MGADDAAIEAFARRVLARRDTGAVIPLAGFDDPVPDQATGYRIQAAATAIRLRERGDTPIGYKVAVTSAAARAHLAVDAPFFGRLFRSSTSPSGATLPAAPGLWQVHEPEIAIRMARDLPAAAAPYTPRDIAAATAAVLPSIEVVGCRFQPWEHAGAPNLIADNAAHGHWVAGPETTVFAHLDLAGLAVTLQVNGAVASTGRGGNVDGGPEPGPFGAACWLANTLAARGLALRAGEWVTTGTTTAPVLVAAGQDVIADFGILGRVTLRIGPSMSDPGC